MKITRTAITVKELTEGYVNETEQDIEKGVYAYGGRLCVRPAFQRSFVYDKKQENAVIDTAFKGFPLNIHGRFLRMRKIPPSRVCADPIY